MTPFETIKNLLSTTPHKLIHHEPTHTSEESARVRGEPLEIGAKAIVLKLDENFRIFVISAAKKVDSATIKRFFDAKKSRFATPEELFSLTGLVPGSIPPFGKPVFDLPIYVDRSITELSRIAFNAGSLTDSIILDTSDYLAISKPDGIFDFSAE